jgi:hypothetical protein
MEAQASLAETWETFEEFSVRLVRYLKTSEEEFCRLIGALDDCWNLIENVRGATAHLAELTGAAGGGQTERIRQSMLDGCGVSRSFLAHIQGTSRQLDASIVKTRQLLGTSRRLQEDFAPLKYIAFHFRLEGSQLSPGDNASVLKMYQEMLEVLSRMKHSEASQEETLGVVLEKLSSATRLVEQASASFSVRANESEQRIQRNLDLLLEIPSDLLAVKDKADVLAAAVADGIRESVKALQGHDQIRQRLEHILSSLAAVREGGAMEPGHALFLQRQQTKQVLELIVGTGRRIQTELNGVIGSAQGLGGQEREGSGIDQAAGFEAAVDLLASLGNEVGELLQGEAGIANFVLGQVDPIRDLLSVNSGELETLARSMKRLALNVMIGAEKVPGARGIDVLGAWTSEAAERVLKLARGLNEQFAELGDGLRSQAAGIATNLQTVESCHAGLGAHRPDDALRGSRRIAYDEVDRLCREALHLKGTVEALVQSMKFADEGTMLLGDLDGILGLLLEIYPKPEQPFDADAAAAGYTMREQHEVHAKIFGGAAEAGYARLGEASEGEEYGDNVELF